MHREWLDKPYEMHPDPPPAMSWGDYEKRVSDDWARLINSNESRRERTIQRFLEAHPCMVPGAVGLESWRSHSPFVPFVITQPTLRGIGTKGPDFMWIAGDSATLRPVLIEIETPHKRWFTKRGHPTGQFTQAHHQLAEWKDWMSLPSNEGVFFATYEISDRWLRSLAFEPHYVLVYGRHHEFAGSPDLNRQRAQLRRDDETLMTFDRLAPQSGTDQAICVTRRPHSFEATSVPATFCLGPCYAKDRERVRGIAGAIMRNQWINRRRKEFLVDRIDYWNRWAGAPGVAVTKTGDWE